METDRGHSYCDARGGNSWTVARRNTCGKAFARMFPLITERKLEDRRLIRYRPLVLKPYNDCQAAIGCCSLQVTTRAASGKNNKAFGFGEVCGCKAKLKGIDGGSHRNGACGNLTQRQANPLPGQDTARIDRVRALC
ncbi:hypothetical protein JTE90_025180 [Oedothorax gibbosus]|uniref:Uncharacterized protein n=1 Tax=Oedothorax gibbosus TaxID=931172 RepID=A0AAV6TK16_9ARAC|nr:hypothetical protein JTE90_025180 [Oedothorax gibbosus]